MYRSATTHSEKPNRTAKISVSGIATAAWSRDHGNSRRVISSGSVLQPYRTTYAVRSTFLAAITLLVFVCFVFFTRT